MESDSAQGYSNNTYVNRIEKYENDFDTDENDIEMICNDKTVHHFKMELGQSFASMEDLILEFKNRNRWDF